MQVKILKEAGYEEALMGLSLSFYDHKEPLDAWWSEDRQIKAARRAAALAGKGGGHDKFLRSIAIWLYVQAPRSFWSEFDTYQVGMTKNSSSTMHTLDKRAVKSDDFEDGTSALSIEAFNQSLVNYKDPEHEAYKDITRLKCNLPEGWLQERQIQTNYAVLGNIVAQRERHRLQYWKFFVQQVREQAAHPVFLNWR